MKKEDLAARIQAIGTCEDEAQRRTLLAEFQTDCEADYDNLANLQTQNQNLTADNENLRAANMKLFLRVGESKTEEQKKKDETGIEGSKKEPLKYENLFDEKGGLK